jgi:hypothetical protein
MAQGGGMDGHCGCDDGLRARGAHPSRIDALLAPARAGRRGLVRRVAGGAT